MKRPTIFRTVILLTSLCALLWQAPRIEQMVHQVRTGLDPAAAIAGLTGKAPMPTSDQSEVSIDELRDALAGSGAIRVNGSDKHGDVVVFTPGAENLTPEQREALRRQAERLRPDVAPSEFRARVSLPPSLRPSRPEGETGADAKKPDAPGNNAEHAKSADGSRADAEGGKPGESLVTTDDQWETVGVHDQLRELLNEIAPPQRDPRLRLRHVNHLALRNAGLPRNPAPTFIIGPAGSASND